MAAPSDRLFPNQPRGDRDDTRVHADNHRDGAERSRMGAEDTRIGAEVTSFDAMMSRAGTDAAKLYRKAYESRSRKPESDV